MLVRTVALHSALHTSFQFDIFVKLDVGPIVHELYYIVLATYTVYTSEALDDAHGVPVNVVIDQVVTILEVLTFRRYSRWQ